MCILFFAINQHPEYPLIICANRDEFYARPTQAAHFWASNRTILAGKDLQAGGSWLGVNTSGVFAAITNIRTGIEQLPTKISRGELVTKALESESPIDFNWLKKHSEDYNPFNLIYGSFDQLFCYNSREKTQTKLANGFHAISNGALDDIWPKMAKGESQLEQIVSSNENINSDELFAILRDSTQAEDSVLPNTGIPTEWEKRLSSIFINSPEYGTRSSCIILQNKNHELEFVEQSYDVNGNKDEPVNFLLSYEQKN